MENSFVYRCHDIRDQLLNANNTTYQYVQKKKIDTQLGRTTWKHDHEYYASKVALDIVLDTFYPEVEVVTTEHDRDLWSYFKMHTSSCATAPNVGRNMKFLVKDGSSGKYVGILALGSDVVAGQARDVYIGWSDNPVLRLKNLQHIANIWACVGLQPVAFNYNIGKLLCSLCFSREVIEQYRDKYKTDVGAITTFGVYGKSVQYDRLPYIKYVGETKGYSGAHIDDDIYLSCVEFFKDYGIPTTERKGKMDQLMYMCKILDIPINVLKHGQKRSVYIGFTPNGRDFLLDKCDTVDYSKLHTIREIGEWWKQRWACKRVRHLTETNRLKISTSVEWTTVEYMSKPRHIAQITDEDIINVVNNTELHPAYVAGFIDGDGSITLSNPQVCVTVGQCDPMPLLRLQYQFGGTLRKVKAKTARSRMQYTYELRKSNLDVLKICANYGIIKQERCQVAFDHYSSERIDELSQLQFMENFQNACKRYEPRDPTMYSSRICWEYIAGLFDAEGCITVVYKDEQWLSMCLTITQKTNTTVLQSITAFIGSGGVKQNCRYVNYSMKYILYILKNIVKHLIVKKEQADICISLLEGGSENGMEDNFALVERAQLAKHIEYHIKDETLASLNKNSKEYIKTKAVPPKIIYNKREMRKRKSVPKSEAHKVAISMAQLKRNFRDDTVIDNVRMLLQSGKTSKQICLELGIPRAIVSKIKTEKVLKKDEITMDAVQKKLKHKELTFENDSSGKPSGVIKASISRRKVTPSEMKRILEIVLSDPSETATTISRKATELFNKSLSVTVVKSVIYGETKPYDQEFENEYFTKEEYERMLSDIKSRGGFRQARNLIASTTLRKVPAEVVVSIWQIKKANSDWTHRQILDALAQKFDVSDLNTEKVRSVLRNHIKLFELEFPICGMTYEEYMVLIA
jgi:predicted RNA binding protein with dsRBD fold (UPF0201 family)